MRPVLVVLLLSCAACELEGPEDKVRDFETIAEAEARHAAERAAAEKRDGRDTKPVEKTALAPGQTELEAHRDGDSVVVDYRGWLTCDGNYEMRPAGSGDGALRFIIVDRNTSKKRASCAGAVELHTRVPGGAPTLGSVRVDQGPGYGERTAPIQ